MKQALAEEKEATAEADLYQLQINDAEIKADLDGVIIRGDNLEEKNGLAVKKGDILMEVARSGELRDELAVSERDIQELREHVQKGTLATSSFPSEEFHFTIDRIVAPGEAKEGDNVFKVYATLDQKASWMRPGMAGEAKVNVEHRRLVWIWTHRLVDFLKLKLWM
jgi:multidrug efflux pump subunit AcrA (membrane-fusion protein)